MSFHGENTVGVWAGEPLDYRLLASAADCAPKMLEISAAHKEGLIAEGAMSEASCRRTKQQRARLVSRSDHQVLGYVGRLTLHTQYRGELASLKAEWERLPRKVPINIELRTLLNDPLQNGPARGEEALADDAIQFYQTLTSFLARWQLLQLITWDLPLPQRPRIAGAGQLAAEYGPDTLVYYYPPYYDVSPDAPLLEQIRIVQSGEGQSLGVNIELPITDLAGRYNKREDRWMPSEYETTFRMWFIESTTVRRYGMPKGLMARLRKVFQILFRISYERVRKLQRHYTDLLYGPTLPRP